jgi:hypothetical protein
MAMRYIGFVGFLVTGLASVFSAGCSSDTSAPVQGLQPQPAARGQSVVVVSLHTRDRIVDVCSGARGPQYTVRDKSGKVLAVRLTLDQLQAGHPDLYHVVNQGMADRRTKDHLWNAAAEP